MLTVHRSLIVGLAAAGAVLPAAAAQSAGFAPHRAVYEVTLLRAAAGSGVSDMTGRMVYELTGSPCEGYTQNMRFVTRSANGEAAETINDLRTSSWEETGGKRLRFSSTQYQNDQVAEASQGDVNRGKNRPGTQVDLVRPAKKSVPLPAEVYFPMQHAAALLDAARAGKLVFTAPLYDGSEKGEKYYTTTAVIGKKLEPGAVTNMASVQSAETLAGLTSWPMAISYFDAAKKNEDSPPVYELSFRYFENGVTTNLTIDYGDFALKAKLERLELLAQNKCNAAAH